MSQLSELLSSCRRRLCSAPENTDAAVSGTGCLSDTKKKKTVQDLLLFVFCGFTSTSAQLKTSPFLTMCRIVATATSARMKKWKSVNAICLSHEAVRFPWIRRNYIYGGMDSTSVMRQCQWMALSLPSACTHPHVHHHHPENQEIHGKRLGCD